MANETPAIVSPGRRLAAWGVHLFTASGLVWGFYALAAATLGDWQVVFVMMTLAMVVDSFDGFLARAVRVDEVTPDFDGALLDNIVDFLNYVVVPAFIVWRSSLVPQGTHLEIALAILLVSGYQFCHRDAKTADHFFRGFPSFWNVAVFYLFLLQLAPARNLAILWVLALSVFVPVKWAYPSRMLRLRRLTLLLTMAWGASVVALVTIYPAPAPRWLLFGSLAYLGYYALVSLYLSVWLPRQGAAGADAVRP